MSTLNPHKELYLGPSLFKLSVLSMNQGYPSPDTDAWVPGVGAFFYRTCKICPNTSKAFFKDQKFDMPMYGNLFFLFPVKKK